MEPWRLKLHLLENFYGMSLGEPRYVAEVRTSGSYAAKARALAALGSRSAAEARLVCVQADHLRKAFKVMDDILDEDAVRDHAPAFWAVHGAQAAVEQAAWHVRQARGIALRLGIADLFERRLLEVISGARLEVEMESASFSSPLPPPRLWERIVLKESSFRQYLAEALGCGAQAAEAARLDGVAAQMLDDGLSELYGKDGRPDNSDRRLGRLTYMKAYGVSAEEAVRRGRELKELASHLLSSCLERRH